MTITDHADTRVTIIMVTAVDAGTGAIPVVDITDTGITLGIAQTTDMATNTNGDSR